MTRGGPEGGTSVVEAKITRKDIIADELRGSFLKWGFDPQVPGEIVNWGRMRLRKGMRGNITSFKLAIESVTSHGYNRETEIRYSHYRRLLRVKRTFNGPDMPEKSGDYFGSLRNVDDIRLGEMIIDGEPQKILIFRNYEFMRYRKTKIAPDGFVLY